MERTKWPASLAMAAGIWLMIAPFVLSYAKFEVVANHVFCGVVIALLAGAIAFGQVHTWADWGLVLLGSWVAASPVMYGYAGQNVGSYHDMALGLAVVALAVLSMLLVRTRSTAEHYSPTFVSAEPTEYERFRD